MFNSQQLMFADSFNPHRIHARHKKDATKSKRRKPLVLVVDDERLIADTMTEILKRCGFHAVCAYEGKSALELARRNTPDFVLTDVVMPLMNGVELAIEIRKVLPDTEVILLSGQAGINDILSHGREEGYTFELFAKPIHPEKLLKRLKGD